MGDLPVGTSPCSSPLDVSPFEIGAERWAEAEKAAYKVIWKIQPTQLSEERRRRVIDYVQRLVRKNIGVELFPYGSVPLKTYLPDGDVDLTAFGGANTEDTLADEIKYALEEEEKNMASEFVVRDVQLIRAEVKLVKCIVQNIVVDVSLNQIGGLSTLCFLEQVDRHVGKDHLFKHSVILIKAWCYYESRILGAHHGLISTYALETMVLYIFHFFYSMLNGPLAVLYKFLDYFSKFDWETYCVSLNGLVRLSSFPAFVAEIPEDNVDNLLLKNDFLSACIKSFSIPSSGIAIKSSTFQLKHLNVIDPLKENNNLGRSVSKGNFYRIRSAFSLGARKLGHILLHPEDGIANELHKFFSNTIARHGCGQRPDVPDLDLPPAYDGLVPMSPFSNSVEGDCRPIFSESSKDVNGGAKRMSGNSNGEHTSPLKSSHFTSLSIKDQSHELCHSLQEDTNRYTGFDVEGHKISGDSIETPISAFKDSACVTAKPVFAPHLFFSKSAICNESTRNGGLDFRYEDERNDSCILSSGFDEGRVAINETVGSDQAMNKNEVVASMKSNGTMIAPRLSDLSGDMKSYQGPVRSETPESLKSLFDFTGDYESYLYGLEYGRRCYEHASVVPSLPTLPPGLPVFQIKNPWDNLLPSSQFQGNGFSGRRPNNFHPSSPLVYSMPHMLLPAVPFGWDEMPKPRGTGTYFPNMSPQGYRSPPAKGRNQSPSTAHHNNNARKTLFMESNMLERRYNGDAQSETTIDNSNQPPSPNGSVLVIELERDGVGGFEVQHGFKTSTLDRSKLQRPASSSPMPRPLHASIKEQDRIALRSSYHLKDEDDFPPLSV